VPPRHAKRVAHLRRGVEASTWGLGRTPPGHWVVVQCRLGCADGLRGDVHHRTTRTTPPRRPELVPARQGGATRMGGGQRSRALGASRPRGVRPVVSSVRLIRSHTMRPPPSPKVGGLMRSTTQLRGHQRCRPRFSPSGAATPEGSGAGPPRRGADPRARRAPCLPADRARHYEPAVDLHRTGRTRSCSTRVASAKHSGTMSGRVTSGHPPLGPVWLARVRRSARIGGGDQPGVQANERLALPLAIGHPPHRSSGPALHLTRSAGCRRRTSPPGARWARRCRAGRRRRPSRAS
jgi:hypothetical protein